MFPTDWGYGNGRHDESRHCPSLSTETHQCSEDWAYNLHALLALHELVAERLNRCSHAGGRGAAAGGLGQSSQDLDAL